MNNSCPKCGKKISPFYFKQNCPHCNVDLLYYNLEKRLADDAEESQRQVDNIKKFVGVIKSSAISSPVLIIRLVLFFTPLASMCLPLYADVSIVSIVKSIISGSFDVNAVLPQLISIALVVVLSLGVIISSLFSSTKSGLVRNIIFSTINTAVFVVMGIVIGSVGIGWYITLLILLLELVLHFICNKIIKKAKEQI